MATNRRGNGWQVDFVSRGVRYRGQFDTLEAGETWEQETRLNLKKGLPTLHGPARTHTSTTDSPYATLGPLLAYTMEQHAPEGWKGCKAERGLVRRGQAVVDHFGPLTRVDTITRLEIDTYVRTLKQERNTGGTINRKLAALSKLFTVALGLGVISQKPMIRRQKESEGRLRWLTKDEEHALIRTFNQWGDLKSANLVAFLIDTGLRINEALSLEWQDIHPDHLTVHANKAKSGQSRHVPLTRRVTDILLDTPREAYGPFESIRYNSFRHRFEKARGHCGLGEEVTIHILRHTAASRLVQGGVDLYRVMKFMGHAVMKTTMRYAHLAPNSMGDLTKVLEAA